MMEPKVMPITLLWNELHGKRGSAEVGTILLKWIQLLTKEVNEFIILGLMC